MKLAIIGLGIGWESAPYDCETWGLTRILTRRPVDMVININSDLATLAIIRMCKERNVPYMGIDEYPLDAVVNHFGTDYFSSSFDYAIALAIYKEYKEIHLYGINMTKTAEYAWQRPGANFWCGMAKGRRIEVVLHNRGMSSLMRTDGGLLYGYDTRQNF